MGWTQVNNNGYGVITETIKSFASRPINSSEFSVPAGTDFYIISNYGATNLSNSAHVELFYSDVPGGTFVQRGLGVGGMNATSNEVDTSTKNQFQDISTVQEYPRYRLKINDGGGAVKFVVMWGKVPTNNT